MLMLVTVPDAAAGDVEPALASLTRQGYKVTCGSATQDRDDAHAGWVPYRVEVRGADHEGIVHQIAQGLSRQGISIESAETGTTEAPISGTPLFAMTALVMVPPDLPEAEWTSAVVDAAAVSNVDVEVTAI